MAQDMDSDHKGPGEFVWFACELLPDELWFISILVGAVFALIWFLGIVFQRFSSGE